MFLSKKFNAESALRDLTQANERQIDALRAPDKGFVALIFSLAKDSFKIRVARRQLAEALNVSTKGKRDFALVDELAAIAAEKKIPGAERLQQLQQWSREFWQQSEVKEADKMVFHQVKAHRIIRAAAQKKPKPS